ncbi:MAG: cyclase family protein [Rhodospirillaceae bacterium]|jgi:kynurenine formamidase|nr:cyclase family protein [Rhodospirillaceae bacterium]MBT4046626.1 cyclase family protein [Rhodospirillaceae bacterium]MBT4689243.1 cyclase family protein [Rhodospirillaceae bacterium]MBT5082332.1 cyclase family protein [Rhodospirillaceae bacterium]MBT5523446.1 cyclase family protein [Rhodospirillaceae bacterium]
MTNCIHDHSQWGPGDQLGAANQLTPEMTLAAMALGTSGEIVDLSHVIENGAPFMAPNQTPYVITSGATARNSMKIRAAMGATNEVGANLERVGMTMHVGTHIDALGHFSIGEHLYGDHTIDESVGDFGLINLGVENIPAMVTRGLCLDVSGLDGGEHLAAGRPISADDLQRVCEACDVAPQPGDVVLLNTGWGRYFMTDNATYLEGEPGLDEGGAKWLTSQGVVGIGADNMALEVLPGTNHPAVMMPVHQHCLVEAGVHIIENMALGELVQKGITAFCFVVLPVKFKGATGCPVRPIAIL